MSTDKRTYAVLTWLEGRKKPMFEGIGEDLAGAKRLMQDVLFSHRDDGVCQAEGEVMIWHAPMNYRWNISSPRINDEIIACERIPCTHEELEAMRSARVKAKCVRRNSCSWGNNSCIIQ